MDVEADAEHHKQRHTDKDHKCEGVQREGGAYESSDGDDDDMLKQEVTKLARQVSSVIALTAVLEQRHTLALGTIRRLERKV